MKLSTRFWLLALLITPVVMHAQDIEQMLNDKPFRWRGGISAYTEFYDPNGIDPQGSTFNWGLRGNAAVSIYGWEVPFAFSVGRQRTNFNYPIYNQFGLSPKYKWLTVHLGHRNLYFSPFTLGGHTMQGAGFELNPGKLRIAAMAGTLRKPVDVRPQDINDVIPAYKRKGFAVKAGLGTTSNYVDLIFMKAKDDSTSIENPFNPDLTPASNTVLGLSVRRQLGESFHFELESGLSVYTRDQQSEGLVDNQEETFWGKIFDLRYSTRINMATRGVLEYQKNKWRTRFMYDRIDPEYESMGTYFFANDVENFVLGINGPISPKISIQTNAGLQRNNLLDNRNAQTSRFVGSFNMDIHPTPFYGLNISYSNFNIKQKESLVPLNDSARLSNISHSFMVSPRYSIIAGERVHSFSATLMHQFLDDKTPINNGLGSFSSTYITTIYALSLNAMHQFNVGLNWNKVKVSLAETGQYGATFGYQLTLEKQKLTAGVQGNYNIPTNKAETSGGNNLYANANVSWTIGQLTTGLYYQFLNYNQPPLLEYSESRAGITLGYTFK
jgi:hypothetical protein